MSSSAIGACIELLRLVVDRSKRWAALIAAPPRLFGGLCHVSPQPPLLRLQGLVKVLAQAWAQALAEASALLMDVGAALAAATLVYGGPHSAGKGGAAIDAHDQALALYREAFAQHQVREAWRGGEK